MEVKVFVDGIPRVVCGVTEETTCQEVVTVLAQAMGQPGRYMLRERFKEFQRCMMPSECLLETLKKYGEQAREVQLTLLHSGSPVWDEMSRTKVGRHQPCPQLRRKEAGPRMRRGSSSLSVHRQSLPPLSSSRKEAEQQREKPKRPKRKSLTLMEEAWEWLEGLRKGSVYSTACDEEKSKKADKKNRISLSVSLATEHYNSGRISGSKVRGQKSPKSDLDHQTSCCIQTRIKDSKQGTNPENLCSSGCVTTESEKDHLRETIICQLSYLQDLQMQMMTIDKRISELEEQQRTRNLEQEAQQRMSEEELEQVRLWEYELSAEKSFERVLLSQFLEMKARAADCKVKLEEYKCKLKGFDLLGTLSNSQESELASKEGGNAASEISAVSTKDINQQQSEADGDVNINRKLLPRDSFQPPPAPFPASQIKERRPTGPQELREWWTRWSEAQHYKSHTQKKEIHRTELTIYLAGTRV